MRSLFFEDQMDEAKHTNILYGLGLGANCVKGDGGGAGYPSRTASVAAASREASVAERTPSSGSGGAAATGGQPWDEAGGEGSAA